MPILENWQQWTSFLGQNVAQAEQSGMTNQVIQKAAVQIGEYLANNVDPKMNKNVYFLIYGALLLKMRKKHWRIVSLN